MINQPCQTPTVDSGALVIRITTDPDHHRSTWQDHAKTFHQLSKQALYDQTTKELINTRLAALHHV
jgi:hypothetical protein